MNSNQPYARQVQALDDLIETLEQGEHSDYGRLLRSMPISAEQLESYCSWSQESYTRNCLAENDEFELILLCWEVGQKTSVHNHGGEQCWVKVVQGELKETIYKEDGVDPLNSCKSSEYKENEISYMIDFMGYHSLENIAAKRSMTLHLYAKPIRSCKVYDQQSKQFAKKKLSYDTFPQVKTQQNRTAANV